LLPADMKVAELDLLFAAMQLKAHQIDRRQFMSVVSELARRLFPSCRSAIAACNALSAPNGRLRVSLRELEARSPDSPLNVQDELARRRRVVLGELKGMEDVLDRERKPVRLVFDHYAVARRADKCMAVGLPELVHFGHDFCLIPSLISRQYLATLFAELAAGADELGYEAFEVFLCRVAVDTFSEEQGYPSSHLKLCGLLQWLDRSGGKVRISQRSRATEIISNFRLAALRRSSSRSLSPSRVTQ